MQHNITESVEQIAQFLRQVQNTPADELEKQRRENLRRETEKQEQRRGWARQNHRATHKKWSRFEKTVCDLPVRE